MEILYIQGKERKSQVVSASTRLEIHAPVGKKRLANVLDYKGIIELGKEFSSKKANRFFEWFTFSDESMDGKSKKKPYAVFESFLSTAKKLLKRMDYSNCMPVYLADCMILRDI